MNPQAFNTYFYNEVILKGIEDRLTNEPTYVYASANATITHNETANSVAYAYDAAINNVVFGKRITSSNLFRMVTKRQWTAGTVYQRYSCSCPDLSTRTFYVINSQRAVFKCIDNNKDSPSTVEPISLDPFPTTLTDGYTWQYMYRLTEEQLINLSTVDYIPVIPDANVTANAIAGTIDMVPIISSGINYNAHHEGFITAVISNTVFGIDTSASPYDGVYTNSGFYIENGPGYNQLSKIAEYTSNSSGRYVTLESPMTGVSLSSQYSITPYVEISGNGEGAQARTLVVDGRIDNVEVINRGNGYTYATAEIVANTVHGSGAEVIVTMSPVRGHGHDPAIELASKHLLINMDFVEDELATIPVEIDFSRYGLISNLKTNDGVFDTTYGDDTFNNTAQANVISIAGNFQNGDVVTTLNNPNKVATILNVDGNNITFKYIKKVEFELFDQLIVNDTQVRGQIVELSNPDIWTFEANPMSVRIINSIHRTNDDTETINMILEF